MPNQENSKKRTTASLVTSAYVVFTYSESTDIAEYQRLKELYQTIRDVVYRITESENLIIMGLKNL